MDPSEFVYILNFSGNQWSLAKAVIDKAHSISILRQMPSDIGFQKLEDGSVEVFFHPDTEKLDWKLPHVIRLNNLANEWHQITDGEVLYYLLESFINGLSSGVVEQPGDLYIIIPYRWHYVNRQKIRQLFSKKHPVFRFRGFINEGIALLSYWKNFEEKSNSKLIWLDGRLPNRKVWYYNFGETFVEINGILVSNKYRSDIISDIVSWIWDAIPWTDNKQEASYVYPYADVYAVVSDDKSALEAEEIVKICEAIDINLALSHIWSESETTDNLLLGSVCWIDALMGKGNCKTGYQITYDWMFSVQVGAYSIIEVVPKNTDPPVKVSRSLVVSGEILPFPLNLYCCALPLASLRIDPDRSLRQAGRFEMLVEVELLDRLRGNFSVTIEQGNKLTESFRVPVLIE